MFTATMDLELSADDLRILRSMIRSTTLGAGLVRRARVVLALHAGDTYSAIVTAHGVTDKYIAKWKQRVRDGGILALGDAPRSGRPDRLDPRVTLHFTPTYSSWLNQVELWFAKIERDLINRGVFTSTKDIHRKLMIYIGKHNATAKPIKWKYADPRQRIRSTHAAVSAGTSN